MAEEGADSLAGFDGGAGEDAVVAHAGEAFGKDVKKPSPNEFGDGEL